MLVAGNHEFVAGSYCAPVLSTFTEFAPPQTIIFVPVHTAVCNWRPIGALLVVVALQELAVGSYWPPVLSKLVVVLSPPTQSCSHRSKQRCDSGGLSVHLSWSWKPMLQTYRPRDR